MSTPTQPGPSETEFAVWAPRPTQVRLALEDQVITMQRSDDGWWTVTAPAAPDARYGYLIDDNPIPRPDPRSKRQPDGVHGLSARYDESGFAWTDQDWPGRELAGGVVYELHIGTFTPDGTLDSAIERLDYLVELGIDFVELLPVNSFNGTYNWGYDGVLWYAVHEVYGGPAAYQRFVDACHSRGLAVIQDVVHNHLGASGNYLPEFAPYLSEASANTWGSSVNLSGPDSAEVRRYLADNVQMFLRDYHVDGLRLDAVHALVDDGPTHILEQFAIETDALSAELGRPLTLIAESDLNDPALVTARVNSGYGLTAQWSDDFHHSMHALLTGEGQGYYADFAGQTDQYVGPVSAVARTLTHGFFHTDTWSSFRGRNHGKPVDPALVPGWKLLGYLQDHDQIGNRAIGDRLSDTVSPELLLVGATLVLTSPFTPMIFMGEEWAAGTPWMFFTSHPEPELGKAVADGRIREFVDHGWAAVDVPDPQDPDTYARSNLDWSELDQEPHARVASAYRELLRLRHEHADLWDPDLAAVQVDYDESDRWLVVHRGGYRVVANLSDRSQDIALDDAPFEAIYSTGADPEKTARGIRIDAATAAIIRVSR